ncbi:DUF2306 domain-containing protein [Solwaraspora sp. WMMD791]|uniref:DUF2306 domain-containing protein n=1 Tax=Solwaraspora sp. WMMD791 TaxID=3016086 RepID=UPI00249CC49D|nr:DUF2306 domain-containing protein [Solwaraspora sp. WMMD791]WFE27143.1 DUF2306 domain-containing protein [Solwaraspora sp. WMMD791]
MSDTAVVASPPVRTTSGRPARRSRTGWTAVLLTSLAIAGFSLYTYASADLRALADDGAGLAGTYVDTPLPVRWAFYVHVALGSLALLLGPWQFSRRLRRRWPVAHRSVGVAYLLTVGVAAVCALVMLPFNQARMVGFFGFGALALLWAFTAWRGFDAARRRDLRQHQAWMIRNYALTFAAVTLRSWVGVLIVVQLPFAGSDADPDLLFETAYAAVPFLCWLPNVIVAEWLIRRRGLPSFRLVDRAPDQGVSRAS